MKPEQKQKKVEDIYPLSPMQLGLLFHALYDPDSPIYTIRYSYTIEGDIDVEAFKKSIDHIMKSHPVFRTIFRWEGVNEPVQIVLNHRKPELAIHDFRSLDSSEQDGVINNFFEEDRKKRFDLSRDLPVRLNLLLLQDKRFCLVFSLHHIIMDGWSLPHVFKDLMITYMAVKSGSPLPSIKRPLYRNYIAWLKKQDKSVSGSYWKELFEDFDTPVAVPADYRPNDRSSHHGGRISVNLPEEMTKGLSELARKNRVTLNTLIQAAWGILLNRYSMQDDIVFGVTLSGRPMDLPGADEMIGLFINTLPVRIKLSDNDSLQDIIQALQSQSLKIQEYGYSFLPDVKACSALPNKTNLFETLVIFENYPIDAGEFEHSPIRIVDVDVEDMTHFDLTLVITPGQELALSIGYASDLFEDSSVQRMINHLTKILESFVESPGLSLSDIEFIGKEERERVINSFNDTALAYPKEKTIIDLFESKVDEHPERDALVFGKDAVTYGELNIRANQLSRYLSEFGIGANTLTAILTQSPVDTVVSILGILKSGGAYLPIDPEFPEERINYILEDSNAPVVIAGGDMGDRLSGYSGKIVLLDKDSDKLSLNDESNPSNGIEPESIAYAIYTSGSTGRPKGTLIPHRGVVNLVAALQKEVYTFYEDSLRVAQLASFTFDASVQQIFASLLLGHTLYPVTGAIKKDVPQLSKYIIDHKIEIIDGTPSLWELLVDAGISDNEELCLRHIIIGGEALPSNLIKRYKNGLRGKDVRWTNVYGVTEASVDSTSYLVDLDELDAGSNVPIGRPLSNTRIYILDKAMNPVPIGISGEIYIGGDGLATEYLNNPERTRESFVPNPFDEGKIYKTGDLGRWLPDGTIEFLGRIDFQVKIRGYRIELGEIESVLSQHKSVNDCVVVAKDDGGGEKYLAAYYASDDEIIVSELRDFLSEKLPDYMVPQRFVRLDALPLNTSGKVDRNALPELNDYRPELETEFVAPSDEIELELASIFKEILNIERIGIYDNFFDLGGHSLTATRVISRIKKGLGSDLPLKAIFENPTIDGLKNAINGAKRGFESIEPLPKRELYELSHAQNRLYFLEKMLPGQSVYNMPMAFILEGSLDIGKLGDALQTIVDRNESLRTSFIDKDGMPYQVIAEEYSVDIKVEDATAANEQGLMLLAAGEMMTPFDLAKLPLFRLKLFRLADDRHLLVFTIHHIISDGWSMEILIRELVSGYLTLMGGSRFDLPELHIQYKDYAAWQNRMLDEGNLKDQEECWTQRLSGTLPILNLPTDRPRPPVLTQEGAIYKFSIDPYIASRLNDLSRKHDATLFMTLLAAFAVTLNRMSNQDDIIIGSPIAGRNHPDLENLIGFFVNTMAFRVDLTGSPSFTDLLGRIKDMCLEGYANQEYPFDRLIDVVNPVRDTSRNAIFDVFFALQNVSEMYSLTDMGDFRIKPIEGDMASAKFDLSLYTFEHGSGLDFQFEFNTNLYNRETIERFAGYFARLCENVIADPAKEISRYEIMGDDERDKLLVDFNKTLEDYEREKCTCQLFEDQVKQIPDSIALVFGDTKVTYKELNERSNQLARLLREKGVEPGRIVGILVERSLEMIIGLLGILKAGGAYLPLDPLYPEERIKYMLEDSDAPILLTQEKLLDKVERIGFQREIIDIFDEGIYKGDASNIESMARPDDLIYVIYTSGSTGKPKGVMLEHRNVVNFIKGMATHIDFSPGKTIVALTTISFDIFVLETHLALAKGLTVVMASEMEQNDPALLKDVIIKNNVDMLQVTPSRLRLLMGSDDFVKSMADLRELMVGGEPFPNDMLGVLKQAFNGKIYNVYGPTETTVWSTLQDLTDRDDINIGIPIANTQIYIVDKENRLQPTGVPGELCIGGDGLARGYMNRPDLTDEKFCENPFESGKKMYRTGDLGIWLSNGELQCLGRMDYQVKIRGNRIELGEIESHLSQHEDVSDVTVVDKDDNIGNKLLVAYYVADIDISPANFRDFLKKSLPDYMVPSRFIRIDALPLTPNGKVDRKALPEPEDLRPVVETEYVAPGNDIEKALVKAWEEALNIERIGVNDNFFELGGHSLLIMKVIAKLQLHYPVSIQDFFDYQTVAKLAERITENIENLGAAYQTGDLKEESFTPVDVDIQISGKKEDPKAVLLTGVTGYLGAHLLFELLQKTDAHIYCLVRGKNEDHAAERLNSTIDFYFNREAIDASRITAVQGDIGVDGLGISKKMMKKILEDVDSIVHSAADVRHFGEYSHFENINVLGTKRLLDLAKSGNCKRFHHISTLSVSGDHVPNMSKIVYKETDFDRGQELNNVYAKSKFEAEVLVREAMKEGLNATIYRVGMLVGESLTGKFQQAIDTNAFYGLIKAITHMGVVPAGSNGSTVDMTPIDFCREAIVEFMRIPETSGQSIHVYNPNTISIDILAEHMKSFGYSIARLDMADYFTAINKGQGSDDTDDAIEKLIPFITGAVTPKTHVLYDTSIAKYFLDHAGFAWPSLEEGLTHKLLEYCVSTGFINPPLRNKDSVGS